MPEGVARKKMLLWVNHGVVEEDRDAATGALGYRLITQQHAAGPGGAAGGGALGGASGDDMDDDDAAEAVSSDVQAAEEMSVYRSYIVGMLTNLGRLPLEKIHNNLKMFLQAGDSLKYDKSQRELAGFLSKLCADETLECIDGRYQLRRDNR